METNQSKDSLTAKILNSDSFFGSIKTTFKKFAKDWRIYLFLAPLIIWMVLFVYKPMGGLMIAFKDFRAIDGIFDSKYLGFINFERLMFGDYASLFWQAFRNTFVISLYGLIFAFPIPIILAILFSEIIHEPVRKISQTLSYLPYFLSEVTITGLIIAMTRNTITDVGIITNLFIEWGWLEGRDRILAMSTFFRPVYIIAGVWKDAGYNSIIFFAAIMSVSPTLYEALKVDGGNKLQELRYVTIPGISGTLIIMVIMRIGRMLSVGYERIVLLYSTAVYETADVLSTLAYRTGISGQGGVINQGLGSAIDIFNSVIGFFLVVGANYVSRKVSDTSLW